MQLKYKKKKKMANCLWITEVFLIFANCIKMHISYNT